MDFLEPYFQFQQHYHYSLQDVQIWVYVPLSHILENHEARSSESLQSVLEIHIFSRTTL